MYNGANRARKQFRDYEKCREVYAARARGEVASGTREMIDRRTGEIRERKRKLW